MTNIGSKSFFVSLKEQFGTLEGVNVKLSDIKIADDCVLLKLALDNVNDSNIRPSGIIDISPAEQKKVIQVPAEVISVGLTVPYSVKKGDTAILYHLMTDTYIKVGNAVYYVCRYDNLLSWA